MKISRSHRNLAIRLGLVPHGGTVSNLQKRVKSYGLDISHFKRGAEGIIPASRRYGEDILCYGRFEKGHRLRRSMLEFGVEYVCQSCGVYQWLGKKISLEVDHIDGDKKNNVIKNLRFICPNCHSQTSTFRFNGRKHGQLGESGLTHRS